MTENEAKDWLNLVSMGFYESDERCKAIRVAIQALEELQQYRAIGTAEGYERAIQSSVENYNLYREYKEKVQDFEAIGTIEELHDLKSRLRSYKDQMSIYAEQHKVILASDVLEALEELEW